MNERQVRKEMNANKKFYTYMEKCENCGCKEIHATEEDKMSYMDFLRAILKQYENGITYMDCAKCGCITRHKLLTIREAKL